MKDFFIYTLIFSIGAWGGCYHDHETGETRLLGVVPITEQTVETVEVVADEAKGQGGILGIVGTVVASGIALWRRRKELAEKGKAETAKAVAGSVIDGVDAILKKVEEAKAEGGSWTPTREELLALVKAAQDSAGTRSQVKELISEKAVQHE